MVADGLLTRQRYREVPPRVDYELTERSRELMPVLGALARWGYEWAWGSPRPGEEVNVGAIFRLAPGLIELSPHVEGTVECHVSGASDEDRIYAMTASGGHVSVDEHPAGSPDATVSGNVSAWVRAFGPGHDASALRFEGHRELAEGLLDSYFRAAARAVAAA
jgi:hypothetical protein